MKHKGVYIASFLSLFTLLNCAKEGCNVIPEARVTISTSQGANIQLGVHGNYSYFLDQGYAGVVLINNNGKVYAFDLCSTIRPQDKNRVEVIDKAYFFDSNTGAKWLFDGSPAAIANCPLKGYAVTTTNDGFTYNVRY